MIKKSDAGVYRDFFKNRIIFPICHRNNLVGFTGRTLGTAKKIPKYLNSSDAEWFKKKQIIYNWDMAKQAIRSSRHVIIVEGQFDVVQLWQRNIHNIIGVSGSYFGPAQASFLKKAVEKVTVFSDGDKAGVEVSIRIGFLMAEREAKINIIYLEGRDPDTAAKYTHRFNWEKLNTKYSSSLGKFAFEHKDLQEALKTIVSIKNKIELSYALRELSGLSGYDEKHLEHWLKEYKKYPLATEELIFDKTLLKLPEELQLIAAIKDISGLLDQYIIKKLRKDGVELNKQQSDAHIQELARNAKYAGRLHRLESLKNKEKYAKDLILKLKLNYMTKDVRKLKRKLEQNIDNDLLTKTINKIEKNVKRINKLKLEIKHG